MTKTQKIWLWISLAMFVVPEVLWSPVGNFLYTFYRGGNIPSVFRDNFLMSYDYRISAILVIFLQTVGGVVSLILISKHFKSGFSKLFLSFLVVAGSLLALAVLMVLLVTYGISFP